jgi:hypothetical protein
MFVRCRSSSKNQSWDYCLMVENVRVLYENQSNSIFFLPHDSFALFCLQPRKRSLILPTELPQSIPTLFHLLSLPQSLTQYLTTTTICYHGT